MSGRRRLGRALPGQHHRWLLLLPLLAACSQKQAVEPPPRANDPVPATSASSIISVPVEIDRALIAQAIERAMPRQLWRIDRPGTRCVQPKRVKLLGKQIKVTPPIDCHIIGEVTRGPIRLRGNGRDLIADIPIHAQVSARDIGGLLKGETATGDAMAHARIQLSLDTQWRPQGTLKLSYDWTETPGIDFLGQRITFADKVDRKIAPVLHDLERQLPRELAQVDLRSKIERLWRAAFTSLSLNDHNPPVWMRITPQRFLFDGYGNSGAQLRFRLGIEALTETVVGDRPVDPQPTGLPPPARAPIDDALHFFLPVRADYAQLEPVILRALHKRATRPFDLPKLGPIIARFDKVVAYGTTGNRIAVGVTLAVHPARSERGDTHGTVWLTARPVNQPNSALVHFEDLQVTGDSDGIGGDILIALAGSPAFSAAIADALSQNFTHDLEELKGKIRRAIGDRKTPHFRIRTNLDSTEIGEISAHGQGLYLPVRATGRAAIRYAGGPL